uniref:EGF-like domain-containing protein n=2 Tax=Wuchereria bancrofti TaxID=6293 RepID=A0A1I8EGK4_WUCBA
MQSLNLTKQQREEQIISTSQNDDLANLITSTTTYHLSPDQIACARYEYAEAHRLVPKPLCTCPAGQMPSGKNATCKTTIVSTFGIDVYNMCGGMETIPEERSRLAILVLNRTGLPYQACVRRDGHPVMVQVDCSQCTVEEFDEAFKQNSNDQYVPLRIMELSVGACLTSALNDCDPEHADCLINGPRYECRCHDGWNDTSKEIGQAEGRRCEQLILLADGCILFHGYCLIWWLLLFGIIFILILLLLYWLGCKLYKLCQKRRRRNVIEEQGHLVTSEVNSVKNNNANDKLAIIESINMNNNPNSIDTISTAADCNEKIVTTTTTITTTTDNKCIPNSMQNEKQNVTKIAEKILIKQESIKSLDLIEKNDEDEQSEMQSEKLEQTFDELKCWSFIDILLEFKIKFFLLLPERKKIEQNEQKLSMNQHANINSSILSKNKLMTKTLSDDQNESINLSMETSTSTTANQLQKTTEILQNDDEKMLKNFETMEATNSKVMNISQSVSETSLRTMWELFKQGTWKQSSRPSC